MKITGVAALFIGAGIVAASIAPARARETPDLRGSTHAAATNSALVYVSDATNNLIDVFDRNGTQVGEITSGLKAPAGLFVDAGHNLWVANGGANNVLVFPRGATTPSKTLSDPNQPSDVTICPDGTTYVADASGAGGVGVYPYGNSRATRRLRADVSDAPAFEHYVTCDASGNVFATGLLGISPFFAATGWVGGRQSGYYLFPTNGLYLAGIKATAAGTLFMVSYVASVPGVAEYTEAGQSTGRAIETGSDFWSGIALDRNAGVVFGADPTLKAGFAQGFPGGRLRRHYASSNLASPEGIAFDPGG